MSRIVTIAVVCVLLALAGTAQAADTNTGSGNVAVNVKAEASIHIVTATATLTEGPNLFDPFTGSTSFTYKIRTGGLGTGHIVLQVGAFTGSGAVVPPVPNLSYTCGSTPSGTPCNTPQTASSSSTTPVVSFAGNAHSDVAGDGGSVVWTLVNDPAYSVGDFTAVVTYTISAT